MKYEGIIKPYIEQLTAEEAAMLQRYGRTMGTKICYALRHNPRKLQLDMQKKGAWVDAIQLISRFNARYTDKPFYLNLPVLLELVRTDGKQRYGVKKQGNQLFIRCNQGHSIPWIEMEYQVMQPPEYLYHGTSWGFMSSIQAEGLKPMERQMVHLSWDVETARQVGGRKKRYGDIAILRIAAQKRWQDGGMFYLSENNIWLADKIEAKYLQVME